jgi:hypothetical protein
MASANPSPQPLQLIRLFLMAGVLMFGAVVLVAHRKPNWKPGVLPDAVDYALVAYAILAVSIAAVLKGRVGREPDPQRRPTLLLAGWVVGESAALFGVMIFYITGQGQWYGLGLLAMVSAFVMLSPGAASPAGGSVDASG